jgi:hypothetical protein
MEQEPNQAGGETIWVLTEDELSEVPASHRELLTDDIREAFESPQGYLLKLSVNTTLPAFAEYLQLLIKEAQCALMLATADEMFGGPQAAFHWWARGRAKTPHAIFIEPGGWELKNFSAAGFEQLFSQVLWVHWAEFAFGGGLFRPGDHSTLKQWGATSKSKTFPTTTARIFGSSTCGDMLIYNTQGEAGFLSHENGKAYSLGSVADALHWIFNELRQGRTPEFDYERVR